MIFRTNIVARDYEDLTKALLVSAGKRLMKSSEALDPATLHIATFIDGFFQDHIHPRIRCDNMNTNQ